jgi:hypothetical protein
VRAPSCHQSTASQRAETEILRDVLIPLARRVWDLLGPVAGFQRR